MKSSQKAQMRMENMQMENMQMGWFGFYEQRIFKTLITALYPDLTPT
jgi:hypothetical protein